jgi:hypothetical protein
MFLQEEKVFRLGQLNHQGVSYLRAWKYMRTNNIHESTPDHISLSSGWSQRLWVTCLLRLNSQVVLDTLYY